MINWRLSQFRGWTRLSGTFCTGVRLWSVWAGAVAMGRGAGGTSQAARSVRLVSGPVRRGQTVLVCLKCPTSRDSTAPMRKVLFSAISAEDWREGQDRG